MSRPTKHLIYTVITYKRETPTLPQVVGQATTYSDQIAVIQTNDVPPAPEEVHEYARVAYSADPFPERTGYHLFLQGRPQPMQILFLDSAQLISDPHIVRQAIEYNPDKILVAERFMMWDDTHYRDDGFFHPRQMPVSGPLQPGFRWSVGNTAPDHFYNAAHRHINAPFDIQDYRWFYEDDPSSTTPVLREYEGRLLV